MASLLIAGPPGAGKTAVALDALGLATVPTVLVEFTALWAALRGIERDPDTGAYPVRADDDPAAGLTFAVMLAAIRAALRRDVQVIATTGSRDRIPDLLEELGPGTRQQTVEVPREEAAANLARRYGSPVPQQCERALNRWYDDA